MLREDQLAITAQTKILEKYGPGYGVTAQLLQRVADGIATPAEIEQLATKSAQMVDKFKADMRQIEPDDYSDLDIEIITAMAATSYAAFQRRDEAYAKVLPAPRVMQALEGAPAIGGFSALHRYSSDLSPAQTVSQFGLDYTIVDKATGAVETPFLVKEKGKLVPQPFLFSIAMPMSPAIREGARVPLDPRVFQRMKLLAQDPSRPAGDPLKQMAQTLTKSGVCCISQRNPASPPKTVDEQARQAASDQVTAWCQAHGYRVLGANDGPYTGNSMPQYGSLLDGRGSYADLIQEMHTPITPCPPGAVITLRRRWRQCSSRSCPSWARGACRRRRPEAEIRGPRAVTVRHRRSRTT